MARDDRLPIIVGVDEAASSAAALDWAVAEATRRQRPLHLVHVVERVPHSPLPPGPRADNGHLVGRFREKVRALAPDLETTGETVDGDAAAVLLDRSRVADLVVVGQRGAGGFRNLLVGSVALQTASHSHCPVVVVRPGPSPHPAGPIVVGVDGSPLCDPAVEFAFEEAALRGVGLTAVHAWHYPLIESPSEMIFEAVTHLDLADSAADVLAKAIASARVRHPDVPVQEKTVQRHAARALIDASADAALLVTGSRGRGGFAGLMLGSVGDAVIRHAACPVAIIR